MSRQKNPRDDECRHGVDTGGYVVGVGSERGTPLEVIGQGVMQCLDRYHVDIQNVSLVTSVHLKAHDPAYSAFARIHDVPFVTCDALSLKSVAGVVYSDSCASWFDPGAVSELSALFFSGARQLLAPSFYFRLSPGPHRVVVSVCKVFVPGRNTDG